MQAIYLRENSSPPGFASRAGVPMLVLAGATLTNGLAVIGLAAFAPALPSFPLLSQHRDLALAGDQGWSQHDMLTAVAQCLGLLLPLSVVLGLAACLVLARGWLRDEGVPAKPILLTLLPPQFFYLFLPALFLIAVPLHSWLSGTFGSAVNGTLYHIIPVTGFAVLIAAPIVDYILTRDPCALRLVGSGPGQRPVRPLLLLAISLLLAAVLFIAVNTLLTVDVALLSGNRPSLVTLQSALAAATLTECGWIISYGQQILGSILAFCLARPCAQVLCRALID